MKNRNINHPSDYEDVIKQARKLPFPYEVKSLDFGSFRDYRKSCSVASIGPDRKTNDPEVNDLRQIKYTPVGDIFLKIDHEAPDWMLCPARHGVEPAAGEPNQLYPEQLKISNI